MPDFSIDTDPLYARAARAAKERVSEDERLRLAELLEERLRKYRTQTVELLNSVQSEDADRILQLADRAIGIAPSLAAGYTRKMQMLAYLGRQKESFTVAQKGLRSVDWALRYGAESTESAAVQRDLIWAQLEAILTIHSGPVPTQKPPASSETLPLDVLGNICDYLDPVSLLSAQRVCSRWRTAVLEYTDFLRSPVFKQPVSADDVSLFLRLCKQKGLRQCKKLRIGGAAYRDEEKILGRVSQSGITAEDFGVSVNSEIALWRQLQDSAAMLNLFAHVSRLDLVINEVSSTSKLNTILGSLATLSSLTLHIRCKHPGIKMRDATDDIVVFPHLTSLSVYVSDHNVALTVSLFSDLFRVNSFPSLSSFSTDWTVHSFRVFRPLYTDHLRELRFLGGCTESLAGLVEELNVSETQIERLTLQGTSRFDELAEMELWCFEKLRSLRLLYAPMPPWAISKILEAPDGKLAEFGYKTHEDHGPFAHRRIYEEVIERSPRLKRLHCAPPSESPSRFCLRLRSALRGTSAANSLEELDFSLMDGVCDEDIAQFLGEWRWLPRLVKISGLRRSLSGEMVAQIERVWHLAVE